MSKDEIQTLVASLGNLMTVLAHADPQDKAEIYSKLGLTLTYRPAERQALAQIKASILVDLRCPRGEPFPNAAVLRALLSCTHQGAT